MLADYLSSFLCICLHHSQKKMASWTSHYYCFTGLQQGKDILDLSFYFVRVLLE